MEVSCKTLNYEVVTLHSSDLRDSHEYIRKQVLGEQIFTGHNSRRFDCTLPTYLETICVLMRVSQIFIVTINS